MLRIRGGVVVRPAPQLFAINACELNRQLLAVRCVSNNIDFIISVSRMGQPTSIAQKRLACFIGLACQRSAVQQRYTGGNRTLINSVRFNVFLRRRRAATLNIKLYTIESRYTSRCV